MTTPDRTHGRAAFAFIFVTVALDMLALGVIIPVLPKLVKEFEGGDMARAAWIVGIFGTIWAAMQFVFSPVLGALSDRFGRRPVILLSNFGLGLDYVLMALAPTLPWLFVGRVISGVTSASYSTAGAYIADVTPQQERAAKFGMLGAAFGLGFIVGPVVGGLLGHIDLRLPFWAAAALSLANAAYGFFILPESHPKERRTAFSLKRANPLGALKLLSSHHELFGLAGVAALYSLAHEVLPAVFVLYSDHRYHWTADQVGYALGGVGVGTTIVAAVLVRRIVRRVGERTTLLIGLACGLLGFVIFGLAPNGKVFLGGLIFSSLFGLSGPAMNALMSRRVEPGLQGQLQGAISSTRGLAGMLGPVLFTSIFSAMVARGGEVSLGAPFFVAGGLLAAGLLTSLRVFRANLVAPPTQQDAAA